MELQIIYIELSNRVTEAMHQDVSRWLSVILATITEYGPIAIVLIFTNKHIFAQNIILCYNAESTAGFWSKHPWGQHTIKGIRCGVC